MTRNTQLICNKRDELENHGKPYNLWKAWFKWIINCTFIFSSFSSSSLMLAFSCKITRQDEQNNNMMIMMDDVGWHSGETLASHRPLRVRSPA
jgi:hypothetical protein